MIAVSGTRSRSRARRTWPQRLLISFNVMAERGSTYVPVRFDLTKGGVHTLTDTTRSLLDRAVKDKQAIVIEAYLSPEVPREFVPVRKQLISLLRQYDRLGRDWVSVRIVNVVEASTAE